MAGGDGGGRTQDITEGDDVTVGVGNLDADCRLAGDRREEGDLVRRDRVFDVARQRRHSFDLDALREFYFVAGDGWAASKASNRRIDAELSEDVGDGRDGLVINGRRTLGWCAFDKDCVLGKRIRSTRTNRSRARVVARRDVVERGRRLGDRNLGGRDVVGRCCGGRTRPVELTSRLFGGEHVLDQVGCRCL